LLTAFKDEDRQRDPKKHRGTLGKTRGPGVGNSYAILVRQGDPGVGNSYAILGIVEKMIK